MPRALGTATLVVSLVTLILAAVTPYVAYGYVMMQRWDGDVDWSQAAWLFGAMLPLYLFFDYMEWLVGKDGVEWADRYAALVPLLVGDVVLGIGWWFEH